MKVMTQCIFDFHKKITTSTRFSPLHKSWVNHTLCFHLNYQAPYLWEIMLQFLKRRAIPNVEYVNDSTYYRTVLLPSSYGDEGVKGWVAIRNDDAHHQLIMTLSASLLPEFNAVLSRIRHLFDLDYVPSYGQTVLTENWMNAYVRMPGGFDGFEVSVRTILGQQITVQAATTLSGRLVKALGTPFQTPINGLSALFPTPQTLIDAGQANLLEGGTGMGDVLGPLGITGRRAKTIEALAQAVVSGEVLLAPLLIWYQDTLNQLAMKQAQDEMRRLINIKGIGPWTANCIGMRALGYPDAFLETDIGVINAMKVHYPDSDTKEKRLSLADNWHPLRSYAVMNLWK